MDKPEEGQDNRSTHDTVGVSSSIELGKVKKVLSVKMEKPEAHYTSLKPLGKGSFGEVHTARETLLGREVAIKSLKEHFRDEEEVVDRFLKEARGTAQLEHPNIMPVHEMGMTEELGIYFTMKKVEGENLKEILDKLQANRAFYAKTYPLNFLLEVFLSVCNGVAFAHSKDVIHRDLKPANIMIGEFGEVLVLDWGLVKQLGEEKGFKRDVQLRMDEFNDGSSTMAGSISGTPNYMSPEQAEGRVDDIDFQSDVYSLGAILYHILTHLPPFEKTQLRKLMENVKHGLFTPPRQRCPELNIPRELEAICLKAMSRQPICRYPTVDHLAQEVRNYIGHFEVKAYKAPRIIRWWKACKRNPVKAGMAATAAVVLLFTFVGQRAMQHGSYRTNLETAEMFRDEAKKNIVSAKAQYDELQAICKEARTQSASPEEAELAGRFDDLVRTVNRELMLAQSYYENIPAQFQSRSRVREGIIDIVRQRIEFALYRKAYAEAADHLALVDERIKRWEGTISPEAVAFMGETRERVYGAGTLEILESPGVKEVMIFTVDEHDPVFRQGDMVWRSTTFPTRMDPIEWGSYIMEVVLESGSKIPYPFFIEHGTRESMTIRIPDHFPAGMAYVPEGPFLFGGVESRFYREHRYTLDGFFIKQHEVTFAEYLEFWKALDPALKQKYASRIRFDAEKREFYDAWNAAGELLHTQLSAELPVVGITREAAEAYCVWVGEQRGAVVRLPTAEEWEKAARGVDGRRYVWGNGLDLRFALTKKNERGKGKYPFFAPPGSFRLTDRSIYNVLDMAGNVREMTSSRIPGSQETLFQLKGGSAFTPAVFLPCSYASDTPVVPSDVGFRYVQELPENP